MGGSATAMAFAPPGRPAPLLLCGPASAAPPRPYHRLPIAESILPPGLPPGCRCMDVYSADEYVESDVTAIAVCHAVTLISLPPLPAPARDVLVTPKSVGLPLIQSEKGGEG